MVMDMSENLEFYRKVISAFKGMLLYRSMRLQHRIDRDTFIIIQGSGDEELIKYGNRYLGEFIRKNGLKDVVILTSDEYGEKLGAGKKGIKKLKCAVKKLDCLISLYCMYRFTKNILIFSANRPNANRLSKLISTDILTKEEAVAIGIYGLNSIK